MRPEKRRIFVKNYPPERLYLFRIFELLYYHVTIEGKTCFQK
jgi:hypothetical protein